MPPKPTNSPLPLRVAVLLALAACPPLGAQSAAPAPATSEAVVLDPYTVASQRDFGYRATNSSTATGSGEPIINTPLSISIMTEDFLRDKNLTELRDALRYVPGMAADYQQVFSRGFTSVLKVDGSEVGETGGGDFMTYNLDRIEVIKGAVSVLQGRASAGGVVNMMSRRPKFSRQSNLELGYGSHERKFAHLRTTGPLIERKLAYLFSYTKLDTRGWVDLNHMEDDAIQFALEFRPNERLTINANFEQVKRDKYPQQHLTFTHPAFLAKQQEAERLFDAVNAPRPATYPQEGETTAAWLARTGYPPNTPTEVVNVNELMYPRGYRANIQGPQAYEDSERNTGFVEARYAIATGLDGRTYYNNNRTFTEWARQSTFRPVAGIGGLKISDPPQMAEVEGESHDLIQELVGQFSTLGLKHRALGGFEYRETRNRSLFLNGTRKIYDPRSGANQLLVNNVLTANPNGFNYTTPFTKTTERSYYAVDQISALREQVFIFLGGRYTQAAQRGLKPDKFTPQYGALVRVPGVAGVSIFASHGESFRPNYIIDGLGNLVEPTEEANTEAGVKLDMFDSKISASASIFEIEQKNVPLRDFAREAQLGITPIYNVSGLAKSAGAELDLIYTPARNYQLVLGFSRLWEARTVVAQDVRQIGVRLNSAPEWTASFWNKYTFTNGSIKGLYLGLGARLVGEVHVHPSWAAPVYVDDVRTADFLIGYPIKLGNVTTDLSLRVDNILNKFYYDQSFRPNEGRQIYLTARLQF